MKWDTWIHHLIILENERQESEHHRGLWLQHLQNCFMQSLDFCNPSQDDKASCNSTRQLVVWSIAYSCSCFSCLCLFSVAFLAKPASISKPSKHNPKLDTLTNLASTPPQLKPCPECYRIFVLLFQQNCWWLWSPNFLITRLIELAFKVHH